MNTLPIPLPHKVTIRRTGDMFKPWRAECSCMRWQWRSRYWPMAMRMAQGHLLNAPKRAA